MSRSIILQLLFLVSVAFLLLGMANARPANVERQADSLGSPTTLTTTQTTQTVMGPMIQTCTITLTPITDASGKSAVQEVKSCTLSTDAGAGSPGDTQSPGSPGATGTSSPTTGSSTTSSTSTSTSSSPTAVPSPTAASNSTTTASSLDSSSSTTSSNPTQTDPTPVTTLGIPAPEATTSSPPATSPTSATPTVGGKAAATTTPPVPVAASAAADATSSSGSSDASFTLPGKHLSVLPIGLGVFAGISVIALIVVGLVTYERTKYRKAFRQRKLAEAGSVMGYGGMAQRTP